jgi:hypothetical protein
MPDSAIIIFSLMTTVLYLYIAVLFIVGDDKDSPSSEPDAKVA